jgi:2'-5' RNA ligase
MSDVIETPLPASMRNHWWWRPGWTTGRHYYACHLTLDDQPQLRELVARYQQAVANVPGLDLIPPEWLHITMQGIGFTDEINSAQLRRVTEALTQELSKIDPPTVSFRYLTVHPEAIFLKAHPADALYPLRARLYRAVVDAIGINNSAGDMPVLKEFIPHISIAYVNADGQARPIAEALQAVTTTTVHATFCKASLLEFHRDHRMYEWTSATPIAIGSADTDD